MNKYSDIDDRLYAKYQDIRLEEDRLAIENAIENILLISKGEVPGRPEFGSNIRNYLHEIIDELTLSAIESEVINSIEKWEDRVEILKVSAVSEGNILVLDIYYRIKSTNEVNNFTIGIDV